MAVGAVLEPFVAVTLLLGGVWVTRRDRPGALVDTTEASSKRSDESVRWRSAEWPSPQNSCENQPTRQSVWSSAAQETSWAPRRRTLRFFGCFETTVTTPNTLIFKDRPLSRVLQRFPFVVEACYLLLLYWIYQLGRAYLALTLVEDTVQVARRHALQVIRFEQQLHIFGEVPVQEFFLRSPTLLRWINRIYSFIHIPSSILSLVVLFYLTTTTQRRRQQQHAGPALYQARRRTLAASNLLAFVVFTLWPCMPPRLLSDPGYGGPGAAEAKSFGFVDTVHGAHSEASVWTSNKFCNQYAAMPSLHCGYALLIGVTVATYPLSGPHSATTWKRLSMVAFGLAYPALILTAVVATANHFILDAVAGALVCGVAWYCNEMLLNLCVLEDYFLWMLRIHKPASGAGTD